MKRTKKTKAKKKASNQTREFLGVLVDIQKMQSQPNETIAKITNAESDEEAAINFKELIKILRLKKFKQKM